MISLSRIIKSAHYSASEEKVILSVKSLPILKTVVSSERLQEFEEKMKSAEDEAQTILRDAEETASKMLHEAAQQAELLKHQALAEIEQWWQERRQEADGLFQQTLEEARQQGFALGREEGKLQAMQEEQEAVQTAKHVLAQAFAEKERIIAEAEPFLVELSMEVAKKVIGDELNTSPEPVLEIVRRVLRRSRVHGDITVCVNHRYFDYVQEHRTQLLALLDGQAELSIYPDHTVRDGGCVIRTPFGSVDARIDTQLAEIKQVLLDIARGSEGK
ncbi:flagellar assembly protein FliH [Brevibacillus sp. H7]|uniref:flagellar assembly protein FliH n=1 Tax=Brevibacillus sp. H7 TaxID=3349138 RepID=UPI003807779C